MSKVYLVYVVDTTPHGFTSDWQDHREYKLVRTYLDKELAENYKAYRVARSNCSVRIEDYPISED